MKSKNCKVGTRVKQKKSSGYYGQSGDSEGVIVGEAPSGWFRVRWDNGTTKTNTYRPEYLKRVKTKKRTEADLRPGDHFAFGGDVSTRRFVYVGYHEGRHAVREHRAVSVKVTSFSADPNEPVTIFKRGKK